MNEMVGLGLAAGGGLVLGGAFFGGLWWTVRRGATTQNPALWFLGSLLVRGSLVLAGFVFLAGDRWERYVACLVGFVIARTIAARFADGASPSGHRPPREVPHAP